MSEKRTGSGKRTAVLAGLAFCALLSVLAWANRETLRKWYFFWRQFESLGKNEEGYPEYRHEETGIVFVWLPGGEFRMGDAAGFRDEQPVHTVAVSPFLVAKYEGTVAQWSGVSSRQVRNRARSPRSGPDDPVDRISWKDCQEFCEKTGLALPTDAQWEYACRAGTEGDYAGDGQLDALGWHFDNSGGADRADRTLYQHLLEEGEYTVREFHSGKVASRILEGFHLEVDWLWQDPLPSEVECLEKLGRFRKRR